MRIKCDFITNSSSSSFIVIWPCQIKDGTDVSQYIKRDDFWPIIFRDAASKKGLPIKSPKTLKKIVDELCSGWVDGLIDHYEYEKIFCDREGIDRHELWKNNGWRHQCWEEADIKQKEGATKKAKEFIEGKKGYVYFFSYGDEDGGIFSELEHQNNWGGLPYIRVSHH